MTMLIPAEEFFKNGEKGNFSWGWGQEFHIEGDDGKNFIFSSGSYDGTNVATLTEMTHAEWLKSRGMEYSRDKGNMSILHGMRHYGGSVERDLMVEVESPLLDMNKA